MFCSYNFTTYTHYILYNVRKYYVATGKGVEGSRRGIGKWEEGEGVGEGSLGEVEMGRWWGKGERGGKCEDKRPAIGTASSML